MIWQIVYVAAQQTAALAILGCAIIGAGIGWAAVPHRR